MKKYHSSFKSKNKIVNTYSTTTTFNYKLNYFPMSGKTYSASLKNPKIPVFQHLIMKK